MIEVWMRDEYGQASIQGRFKTVPEASKKAMEVLHSLNTDNALTSAERDRNWECFLPQSNDSNDLLYGGKVRGSVHFFFNPDDGSKVETKSAKILLGNRNGKSWYAKNHKNAEIAVVDDPNLNGKAVLFFKKV